MACDGRGKMIFVKDSMEEITNLSLFWPFSSALGERGWVVDGGVAFVRVCG